MKNRTNKKGSTLIETLVYVAIFSILIGALTSFTISMITSRVRNQIILEVNDQGTKMVRTITQSIRNSRSVNTPTISTGSATLSLTTGVALNDPTIFSVSGGVLYITEGTTTTAITNNRVSVSNLMFYNMSRSATPGVVKLSFTISNVTPSSNSAYNYSTDFYGGASMH